jgi:branched-chain amino acid transport system ATP-binding protein
MNDSTLLEVRNINTFYGLSHILFDVSLKVFKGEIVGLLGRNGAGKSTTMKSIMGINPPRTGEILFRGEAITGKSPYVLFRMGIGYVPDDRRVFADLTVEENLEIVYKRSEEWNKERVYELFPPLRTLRNRRAGNLSGGEQQMLTIARALMGSPELLLLDEPTEGLAPIIVKTLEEQIMELKHAGISILLAEQNIRSALKLVDRVYVIDNGAIKFQGKKNELEENEEIKKKYLLI